MELVYAKMEDFFSVHYRSGMGGGPKNKATYHGHKKLCKVHVPISTPAPNSILM